MKIKKGIILSAAVPAIILIIYFFKSSNNIPGKDAISAGSNTNILQEDRLLFKNLEFSDRDVADYFSKDIINSYTLKFFKFLRRKFADSGTDHLDDVKKYLFSTMEPDKAGQMYALYKKYIAYEKDVKQLIESLAFPRSPADMLKSLEEIQNYRRDYFGTEIAEALFGPEYKARTFTIKKSGIINDKELYGAEKEKRIKEMRESMYGNEADAIDINMSPYDKYREKQNIYSRDLSELTEEKRQEKIDDFRKEFFPPEIIARMERVDGLLNEEKIRDMDYYSKEDAIKSDNSLTEDEKAEKILRLQGETYGDRAEAFRRREKFKKQTEEYLKRKR